VKIWRLDIPEIEQSAGAFIITRQEKIKFRIGKFYLLKAH